MNRTTKLILIVFACFLLVGCDLSKFTQKPADTAQIGSSIQSAPANIKPSDLLSVPEYDGEAPFTVINDNVPEFDDSDLVTYSYEYYGELDELGRCTAVIASVGKDIMPTEERGNIGQIKPTGWHTVRYDNVDGNYLYNRCHLIGYQLTGENANERNLITGTRYMNVEGMLPFENMIADYVRETGNHVLYRVTPVFDGDNLLASGVRMEAKSVEDNGDGVLFNVFVHNIQPDIVIDYATGESYKSEKAEENTDKQNIRYILNISSKKIHLPDCDSVSAMSEYNRRTTNKSKEQLINEGYSPCGSCKP